MIAPTYMHPGAQRRLIATRQAARIKEAIRRELCQLLRRDPYIHVFDARQATAHADQVKAMNATDFGCDIPLEFREPT